MDFSCRSSFRGGILADGMGVGKTLTAVLAMMKVKEDPGFSLVVCPKSLCLQWIAAIGDAWQEVSLAASFLFQSLPPINLAQGYGMRACWDPRSLHTSYWPLT